MKIHRSWLSFIVLVAICALFATGCKRRPQDYAGIPDPQKGETIDPHHQY